MISDKDYRVHKCRPGTKFDPLWMSAEDKLGYRVKDEEAAEKDVVLCIFPALVQQEMAPLAREATITEALACNKKFYPSPTEKKAFDPKVLDPEDIISKALVLVEYP
jgi:hypothetical protein